MRKVSATQLLAELDATIKANQRVGVRLAELDPKTAEGHDRYIEGLQDAREIIFLALAEPVE